MTEPTTEPTCMLLHPVAPELALGLVTGRERHTALAHLEQCPDCRAEVERLTRVHDALRTLPPVIDPPAGFESRVLAQLPKPRHHRTRALIAAAAAAVLLVAAWAVGTAPASSTTHPLGEPATPALRQANLMANGHGVGQVFAYPGSPSWIYVYLELEPGHSQPAGGMNCTVVRVDGSRDLAGHTTVKGDDAFWGGPVDTATVAAVEVSDASGAVLATASFRPPAR